jgi:hypothetical protein
MESLLLEEEVLSRQAGMTAENGHNYYPTVGSRSKFYSSLSESVFLVVPMESQLVEEEVLSSQTGITAEKGLNF